jgi:hypothetical protein
MNTLAELRSGKLQGITRLKLSENLRTFPQEIYTLTDTLEILDLSHNALSSLPDDLHRFTKLKIAFFSNNLFTEVPNAFKACYSLYMLGFKANQIETFDEDILPTSISWLILTDNKIKTLPHSIGKLHKLQKCALAGNQIEALPEEMKNCQNLELLRLSANALKELPYWLLSLPKLSWLAFSGNPCSGLQRFELEQVECKDLELQELLGEGASGEIYKAYSKTHKKDVAVKIFKGAVTSDGYAKDEMNAYMSTGEHQHLISVMAKIEEEERLGLLLELIPPSFKNLGNPPNFDTCTRDTFEQNTSFSIESIVEISKAMISASFHLHSRGLMHGDLYAHNILIDDNHSCYLGDFGAASFYDVGNKDFEKIEVRAFGCLLEDLLNLCSEKQSRIYDNLKKLSMRCMSEEIDTRPLFAEMLVMESKIYL